MSAVCYCDYDAPSIYNKKIIKSARKAHQCDECRAEIRPGEGYEAVSGVWDGEFGTYKTCLRCVELREWATISVPCFCWAHGNLHEDVRYMVQEVAPYVPGFFMEYGRRMIAIRRARK